MGLRKHDWKTETIFSETAESSVIPARLNAPQANQNLMNLSIFMGIGTVALCKNESISWAQALMPPDPVEAHFGDSHQQFRREDSGHF